MWRPGPIAVIPVPMSSPYAGSPLFRNPNRKPDSGDLALDAVLHVLNGLLALRKRAGFGGNLVRHGVHTPLCSPGSHRRWMICRGDFHTRNPSLFREPPYRSQRKPCLTWFLSNSRGISRTANGPCVHRGARPSQPPLRPIRHHPRRHVPLRQRIVQQASPGSTHRRLAFRSRPLPDRVSGTVQSTTALRRLSTSSVRGRW